MDLLKFVEDNQFLSGSLAVMGTGSLLYYLKSVPSTLWDLFKRNFVVSLEIRERDESFSWLRKWLDCHAKKVKKVVVHTTHCDDEDSDSEYECEAGPRLRANGGRSKRNIYFSPAAGIHFLKLNGKWCKIDRTKETGENGGKTYVPKDIITISAFGRDVNKIKKIIFDACELSLPNDNKLEVRINIGYDRWMLLDRIDGRSLDSVILPSGIKEDIIKDVEQFRSSKKWYDNAGIPYQRGYCLYGEPGNGKSSIVKAIATHFNLSIYILNLNNTKLDDGDLISSLRSVGSNSLLLIEDIDCTKIKRDNSKDVNSSNISMSGLLNALDGIGTKPGRLLFITTNHLENLDPALMRCGRIDLIKYIGNASKQQIEELFEKFYNKKVDIDEVAGIDESKLSMSSVQDILIRHRNSCEDALNELHNIIKVKCE